MNAAPLPNNEHLLDLLAESACNGLSASQQVDLDDLLADEDASVFADIFEESAAAIAVAFADASNQSAGSARGSDEDMPVTLRRSLSALSVAHISADVQSSPSVEPKLSLTSALDKPLEAREHRDEDRIPMAAWGGWIAAAAAVGFAVLISAPDRESSPREQFASLVGSASASLVQADWIGLSSLLRALGVDGTNHPLDAGVSGRVVMDDATDEGYMEIAGIAENDPSDFQYQLWIFDAERRTGDLPQFAAGGLDILTQRPVDGGVFNFTPDASGSAVIPIAAKIPVGKAVIFAVTKEAPGGVVVSDRDIVFAALVGQG